MNQFLDQIQMLLLLPLLLLLLLLIMMMMMRPRLWLLLLLLLRLLLLLFMLAPVPRALAKTGRRLSRPQKPALSSSRGAQPRATVALRLYALGVAWLLGNGITVTEVSPASFSLSFSLSLSLDEAPALSASRRGARCRPVRSSRPRGT